MIPNLTAHSEGFQRVWNTSVKNWKLTIGNLNMFLFTCWWLAPPWIGDTGSAKIIRLSEYLLTDINSFAFILVSNTLCWAWPYFHMWRKNICIWITCVSVILTNKTCSVFWGKDCLRTVWPRLELFVLSLMDL